MRAFIALALLTAPAFAEPITERGYVVGCSDKACSIVAAGFKLTAAKKGTDPEVWDFMAGLDPITAVSFEGELGELGDITAPVKVTYIETMPDDLYQDTLRYVQGNWKPKGDTSTFFIRIKGMEWQEIVDRKVSTRFLIQPSDTCATGVVPGGIALNLVPIGGDPSWAICWKVDGASETELHVSDFTGEQGRVTLLRK